MLAGEGRNNLNKESFLNTSAAAEVLVVKKKQQQQQQQQQMNRCSRLQD